MDHLRQLSARYNAVWMETSQLYETWARRRGLSFFISCWWSFLLQKLKKRCSKRTFAGVLRFQSRLCMPLSKPWQTRGGWNWKFRNRTEGAGNSVLTAEGREQAAQIVQSLQEHEARVWLRLEVDRAEQLIEYTALYNRYFREVGD